LRPLAPHASSGIHWEFLSGDPDFILKKGIRIWKRFRVNQAPLQQIVESRCGAVAVGSSQLLPPLSVGGATIKVP
jgi:hypothetical protein